MFWITAKRRTWWWVVALGFLAAVGIPRFGGSRHVETVEHRPIRPLPDCTQITAPLLSSHPVSVAPWSGDRYLLCNYRELQEVDIRTGAVRALEPEPRPEVWNPTGVHARGEDGLVFVANYTGHDVFVLRRDGDRLRAVKRIVHEEMRSPENVAVSEDGTHIAVADYDGNRIWLFRCDGSVEWSRELELAHGVAIGPGFIVATGLAERVVVKFDLAGTELCRSGTQGVGPGRYLWPTCAAVQGQRILVSDAHTGHVTMLDHDLKVLDWFGGNGAGAGLFNMPYALAPRDSDLVVCDSFKDRLLILDAEHRCRRVLARDATPLCWDMPAAQHRVRDGYVNLSIEVPVTLPGLPSQAWNPGYGRYWLVRRKPLKCVAFPQSGSLFNGGSQPYLCWCASVKVDGDSFLLLGHSQGSELLVVDARGRCHVQDAERCLWLVDGALRSNAGEDFDPASCVQVATRAFAEHDRRLRDGADPTEALHQAYWPKLSAPEFREACSRTLATPAGQEFWKRWVAAGSEGERAEAVRAFDAALAAEHDVLPLQELFLRNMLSPRP
ncbi:hypothetical protein AYO40_03645 [Planctomycetaceae bacterium SCGC AG-212-D15]|nr:hypothetical protein AYO40_03645 [Planctomycetaceae bacterium SCGC AG-212-D15]